MRLKFYDSCPRSPKSGFALILSLGLMAFVLVSLLGVSTLLKVEFSQGVESKYRLLAEENARLGVVIALGELQRLTGPDERISAFAMILDEDVETPEPDGVGQCYWTGVWDAKTGDLLTWLVSGNEGLAPDDGGFIDVDLDLSNTSIEETVELEETGSVSVPMQNLEGSGGYAFWISDEGVKAKVDMAETHSLRSAEMVDITQVSGLSWLSSVSGSAELRKRTLTLQQLETLAPSGDEGVVGALVHDLTTSSMGLLTNPVSGGMKTDLTLALFDDENLPGGQIFGPLDSNVSTSNDPGGPLWEQLQSWAVTSESHSGDLPVRGATDEQVGFHPVLIQAQYYVLPRYGPAPDRRIILDIMPSVTLWNPYERALEATNYRVDFGRTGHANNKEHHNLAFGSWDFYLDLDGDGSFTTVSDSSQRDENLDGDEQFKLLNTSRSDQLSGMPGLSVTIPSLRLLPGQAVTFSPPSGNNPIDVFAGSDGEKTRASEGENELEPGFRPSASFVMDSGHQLPNSDPFEPPLFGGQVLRNASQSVQLVKTNGSDPEEVLGDFVSMGGSHVGTSRTLMVSTSGVLGSAAQNGLNGALGFKMIRNFVEEGGDPSIQWLSQFNPRARIQWPIPLFFHEANFHEIRNSLINNPSFLADFDGDGIEFSTGMPASSYESGVGYRVNSVGPKRAVLYEAPPTREELRGIGQLMHAPLFYNGAPVEDTNGDGTIADDVIRYSMRWSRFDNLIPCYAVGSSLADTLIPLDGIEVDWADYSPEDSGAQTYDNYPGRHYDYSYLLNQALWDDFFFSSLPDPESRAPANPRLIAWEASETDPLTSEEAGAEFGIDGAFNVNSTSEEAWRAVLGAFFGEVLDGAQETGSPYVRTSGLYGAPFDSSSSYVESDETYFGYRTLTEAQIKNLARQIVKEVKRRGPFTSLSGFVNRSPNDTAPSDTPNGGEHAYQLRGALAAALLASDQISTEEADDLGISVAEARINTALQDTSEEVVPRTEKGFNTEAQVGWRSQDVPGWINQADLLAKIGSALTVRSDTFKIRVLGRAGDSITGEARAEVLGEAIVQRLPGYLDLNDEAHTSTAHLTEMVNLNFGRGYQVVDFRWIE
ncbi:MAG: hypothetical protein ACQKBT_07965 [Puniceicoccales bacterium]